MESLQSQSKSKSKSIPFKSKKPHLSSPNPKKPPSIFIPTPEKPSPSLTRIRNKKFALSISDVRRTALQLQNPTTTRSLLGGSDLDGRTHEKVQRNVDVKKSASQLPEKYEMLCEFFNSMVNSIRLFRLKRLPSTFTKLCRNIESLTDRRFSLHHLAQLKHVMPEVIVVKKIRVQDEETLCMKEELLVTLEVDAVAVDNKDVKGSAGFAHLKSVFQSRISDYAANHPEGDDIPEGELPYLFYKGKQDSEPSMSATVSSLPVSHVSPSFKRRFSSKVLCGSATESSLAKPSLSLLETPIKQASSVETEDESTSDIQATPSKSTITPAESASTPAELVSTPARLMSATPTLLPQKRSFMSPDSDTKDLPSTSSKCGRTLKFDESCNLEDQPSKAAADEDNAAVHCSTASEEVLHVLPEDLVHSLIEKEKKIKEEQDPVVVLARRRQQLMAGVPKLFDMIHLLFQSMKSSVLTKEDLIHKLIAGHMDIVDRSEVEEQLKLLQEVAPEYLSERSGLSGDLLVRVNKLSCPESIRSKLLEAK